MNIRDFHGLPQFDDLLQAKNLKVGDKFLTGTNILEQINSKKVGDTVTYYEVMSVGANGNIAYGFKTEKLDGMNEKEDTR
jgi:hypothetical protein